MAIETVESCGLLCDNNRINQSCFKKKISPISPDTPWIVQHPRSEDRILYLMYDEVHTLKSIRNNWINEKIDTYIS